MRVKQFCFKVCLLLAFTIPVALFLFESVCGRLASDSSIFRYAGWTVAEGLPCYAHAWDHKGPLIFFANAIGYLLFPASDWGPAFVFMLIWLGVIALGWSVAVRWVGHGAASVGILWFVIAASFSNGGVFQNNVEIVALFWAVLACFALRGKETFVRLSITGACVGAAMLVKPNLIAFGGALIVVWLWDAFRTGLWRLFVFRGVASFAGMVVAVILISAPFFVWGNWGVMLDATLWFNLFEYHSSSLTWIAWWKQYIAGYDLLRPGGWLLPLWCSLFLVAVWGSKILWSNGRCREAIILGAWLMFESFAAFSTKGFYGHYLIGSFFPMSALVATCLVNRPTRPLPMMFHYGCIAGATISIGLFALCLKSGMRQLIRRGAENRAALADIRQYVRDGDVVAVWGLHGTAEILSSLRLRTKQTYFVQDAHYPYADKARRTAMLVELILALRDPEVQVLLVNDVQALCRILKIELNEDIETEWKLGRKTVLGDVWERVTRTSAD